MRSLLPLLAAALVVLGVPAATAHAASVSYSASVALQSTDWSATLAIPRFNPALGALTGVTVEVRDSLVHKVEFENKSPGSTSRFRDSVYVTVDVLRPASTSLVTAVSKLYQTSLVGTYDGTVDYAGTSGITVDGLVNYTINSSTTTASADLALFTGTGTIGLPCQASAYFLFSYNGGNASYRLTTQAQALVLVTYTYDPGVVPAPQPSWGGIKSLYR
jgi:hypothetical protein